MKIFMTFNPHLENHSQRKLLENFRYALQKYYRKELGRRYYKHIDNQYDIAIFEEIGKKFFEKLDSATHLIQYIEKNIEYKREPHLHIIADVPIHTEKNFFNSLKDSMESIYSSLTSDFQLIGSDTDKRNTWNYCVKEGGKIFCKSLQHQQQAINYFNCQ